MQIEFVQSHNLTFILFFLDGCYHVYLDIGSNVGVQVRKLFQPELYPGSRVLKVFDETFGKPNERNYSEICTIGVEPNPQHTAKLKGIIQ